jgi:Plastocyanin
MRIARNIVIGAALFAVTGLSVAYIVIRHDGLAADRPPGRIETAIARRLVVLSIPSSMRAIGNPNAGDPDAWRAATDHFAEHCAFCHGVDGRGRSEVGPAMYPPVPDLADAAIQSMSDGALFSIVQNGVRWTGMPAFRSQHTADDAWKLVSFVRRIPQLTPHDLERSHTSAGDAHEEANTVAMDGTTFVPGSLTVKIGATVTWVNKDPFPHNVSSGTGGFHSGDMEPDARWRFQADKVGAFPYVCTLHPGMKGTLIVER